MRRNLWFSALFPALALSGTAVVARAANAQAQNQSQQSSAQTHSQQPPASSDDPLAAAARKAQEQQKAVKKPAKVFTNDDLPTDATISVVGTASAPASDSKTAPSPPAKPAAGDKSADASKASAAQGDEATWRARFAQLRAKLQQDQGDLDIMQREIGALQLQDYSDPNQAMMQGLTRDDINKTTAAVDAKKKQVEADKQAISDAEDALRKAGGDSGWER